MYKTITKMVNLKQKQQLKKFNLFHLFPAVFKHAGI